MKSLQETLGGILLCDTGSMPRTIALRDIDGFDSLRHVMLVVGLEEAFAMKLTAEEIMSMVTLGDIERVLREKGVNA